MAEKVIPMRGPYQQRDLAALETLLTRLLEEREADRIEFMAEKEAAAERMATLIETSARADRRSKTAIGVAYGTFTAVVILVFAAGLWLGIPS
jgi:hypothetical protein